MNTRILKTLAALIFGTGQEFIFQVLSVILWIRFWGVELYSEWLLLSLVPNLLMRGNAGLYHSATSQLIDEFTRPSLRDAAGTYMALQKGQTIFAAFVAVIFVFLGFIFYFSGRAEQFTTLQLSAITALFIAQFIAYQNQQSILALAKANGEAASAVMWQNGFRLAYIIMILAISALEGPVVSLAAAVATQITVVMLSWFRFRSVRLRIWELRHAAARGSALKLIVKGLQFSVFPLGQTAMHTASVWLIGFVFGSPAGAAYHNMRTISRSVVLVARAAEMAVRLELSALFASHEIVRARQLVSRASRLTCATGTIGSVLLIATGSLIFDFLTDDKLEFSFFTFVVLCIGSLFYAVSQSYLAIPFATNNQQIIAKVYLWIVAVSLATLYPAVSMGILQAAALLTLADGATLLFARREGLRLLTSGAGEALKQSPMAAPPKRKM